jgi:hypothetical protein
MTPRGYASAISGDAGREYTEKRVPLVVYAALHGERGLAGLPDGQSDGPRRSGRRRHCPILRALERRVRRASGLDQEGRSGIISAKGYRDRAVINRKSDAGVKLASSDIHAPATNRRDRFARTRTKRKYELADVPIAGRMRADRRDPHSRERTTASTPSCPRPSGARPSVRVIGLPRCMQSPIRCDAIVRGTSSRRRTERQGPMPKFAEGSAGQRFWASDLSIEMPAMSANLRQRYMRRRRRPPRSTAHCAMVQASSCVLPRPDLLLRPARPVHRH